MSAHLTERALTVAVLAAVAGIIRTRLAWADLKARWTR